MSNIEDTQPVDCLATRIWAGTRYEYPHIETMRRELKELRALLAAKDEEIAELKKELHNWRGKASWTGDARDHANDEAIKESPNA